MEVSFISFKKYHLWVSVSLFRCSQIAKNFHVYSHNIFEFMDFITSLLDFYFSRLNNLTFFFFDSTYLAALFGSIIHDT